MDNQTAILACSEQPSIVVAESHALNFSAMGLYFSEFLEWVELPYLDCTRTACFPYTCEECLSTLKDAHLGQLFTRLGAFVAPVRDMPDVFIMANDEYFKLLLRYVADTCE